MWGTFMCNHENAIIMESIDILKCPVCGDRMRIDGKKSIVCFNKHCFDISKKGYVNLLQDQGKSKYDKELFQSRNIVSQTGFFEPLIQSIVLLINKNLSDFKTKEYVKILDAGCGEGFHLAQIINCFRDQEIDHLKGVGIDISKEGIQIAAKNYKNSLWLVADLARMPFINHQFDVILNILSPAYYGEFERTISNQGILIKVVPDSEYLKELRTSFYQETDKEIYSNKVVLEHFGRNFALIDTERIRYKFRLSNEELHHLVKMTPLSWGVPNEKIHEVFKQGINNITADFNIMVGIPQK
jgi:23S rRNA (guanine745-N1)-methyltransferase